MQQVSTALGADAAQNRHTQEGQIADDVEDLVTHKFIGKAQAGFVQHAVPGEHDRVIERSAPNQVSAPERFNLLDESKGARGSDVPGKRAVIQGKRTMLDAD